VVYLLFYSVDSGVSPNYGSLPGATLVGGCVNALMPTCSSLWVAAEPLPGLDLDLLIDEVSHTYMKNLSTNVDGL